MTAQLTGGFADLALEAARAFRAILEATARPGRIFEVAGAAPPAPLSIAAGVALLTLTDGTTPLHLAGAADCDSSRGWIAFHTGAPLASPEAAQFALGTWGGAEPASRFRIGEPSWPDRSATLIVELPRLAAEGASLTGPGIETEARLSLPEAQAFRRNRALLPLGFDGILTCGTRLAALPRSTRVEEA